MMSLKRIFGLMLLFLFFEAVVAVGTVFFFSTAYVLEACLAMTGLAVLTWVIFVVLTRLLSRQRTAKPVAAQPAFVPAVAKTQAADDSFTLELTGLMNEANRRLAALGASGKTTPTVQTLPLYLVIGAEGSGKTTAIVNSGMEARLLAGEAQRDGQTLPTGLANFWFAEGAIFVEIAGRVLMQEPERWEKALKTLAAQRQLTRWERLMGARLSGSNLRGVLLACDMGVLMQSRDVHRLGALARTLNERLQTVQNVMRREFPTYVLLTKSDGVRYFQEFFAQLSEVESRRVLGVTLAAAVPGSEYADGYADREGGRLTKFLNRLYQSLADKRMLLLAREDVMDKRALAYEFPREMRKVRGELVQFLLDVFRPTTMQSPLRLRGFYFSGQRLVPRASAAGLESTSLGSALDYSVVKRPSEATVFFHSAGRSSTLDYSVVARGPADTRVAKQTFLMELFREIVLRDPATSTVATVPQAQDARYLNVAFGACGAFLLVLSVVWVFAWQRNFVLLRNVEAAVRSTAPGGVTGGAAQPVAQVLPELEALRPHVATLHENQREGAPLGMRWGLYAGNRAAADVDSLYYTGLRQAVLDPALFAMTGHFMELRADAPVSGDVYKELKSYRTITSGKCKPPDGGLVASVVLPVWAGATTHDGEAEALADRQVRFYASELKFGDPYAGMLRENEEAVERAQVYLRDLSGPDKILQALLNQARENPAERLSGYSSNYSQVLTGPDQMDGPYTRAGWQMVDESIRDHKAISSGEECVVGKTEGRTVLKGDSTMDAQVRKLYSDTYAQTWKQYLESHHVVPFASTTDAAQKLRTLADNNRSPLLALVYMTSANTNVGAGSGVLDQARGSIAKLTTGTVGEIKTKLGIAGKSFAGTPATATETPQTVAAAFDPVHAMVDPGSPNKWLNEKNQPYMKALGDLSDALQTLPGQVHNDVPLETQELQGAKTALLAADSALHGLAANFPNTASGVDVDLENLLREPIEQARRTIAGVAVLKALPAGPTVVGAAGGAPPPAPADPGAGLKVKATIHAVNASAVQLCSTTASLQKKFPFDATSGTDASLDDLNQLLQPGTGAYSQFANLPEVSKTYNHAGRVWAAKEFPANYSQPFVTTLNSLGETEDEMYGEGSAMPHVDLTLSVDGTGKLPFELDVDGHTIKFTPGKPTPPMRLVWPPVTSAPTKLVLKTGGKGPGRVVQFEGPWSLFRLLQNADDQSGNVFTFRSERIANSLMPLTNDKGGPATVQIRIDSAASNLFGKGYFARLRCGETWALQGQGPGN